MGDPGSESTDVPAPTSTSNDTYTADPDFINPTPEISPTTTTSIIPVESDFQLSSQQLLAHDDASVAELLSLLEEHREDCQANGRYREAEAAHIKLTQLRAHETTRRRAAMLARHTAEQLDLEKAHHMEIGQFNEKWDAHQQEQSQATVLQLTAMRQRHQQEMSTWTSSMESACMTRPKYSRELLEMRSIEVSLAKAKKYREAEKMRERADIQQAQENEIAKQHVMQTWQEKKAAMEKKHATEMASFLAKREAMKEKNERMRAEALETQLLQKYRNLRAEVDRQHHMELMKLEKMSELGISVTPAIRTHAPSHTHTSMDGTVRPRAQQTKEAQQKMKKSPRYPTSTLSKHKDQSNDNNTTSTTSIHPTASLTSPSSRSSLPNVEYGTTLPSHASPARSRASSGAAIRPNNKSPTPLSLPLPRTATQQMTHRAMLTAQAQQLASEREQRAQEQAKRQAKQDKSVEREREIQQSAQSLMEAKQRLLESQAKAEAEAREHQRKTQRRQKRQENKVALRQGLGIHSRLTFDPKGADPKPTRNGSESVR